METLLQTIERTIRQYPILSTTDENQLLATVHSTDSSVTELDKKRAREKLINSNLRLVYSIVIQTTKTKDEEDFVQLFNAGVIGLTIAIDKFNSDYSTKLGTYAYRWILFKIRSEYMKLHNLINIPVRCIILYNKLKAAEEQLQNSSDSDDPASVDKYNQAMEDLSQSIDYYDMFFNQNLSQVSLDECISNNANSDDQDICLIDSVADTNVESPVDFADHLRFHEVLNKVIDEKLSPREAIIFKRYYDLDNSGSQETLNSIGQDYGITRERVRQIIAKSLDKLRNSQELRTFCRG